MTIKRLVLLFLLSALLTIAIQIGCDTLVTEINESTIAGHPTADFELASPSSGMCCAPCTAVFSDASDGPRQVYIWAFGDGDSLWDTLPQDPSNYQPPTHVYDSPGIYAVSLKIIDTLVDGPAGEDTEIQGPIFLYVGATTAGFEASAERICPGGEITFTPDAQHDEIEYKWFFGDGSDSSLEMLPTHIFADTGTFTVVLEATDSCSTGIDSVDIFVGQCPDVAFAADVTTGCDPLTVIFADFTQVYGKEVLNYEWSFGDGNTSNEIAPQHDYSFAGAFTVSLTVTTEDGISADTVVDMIAVYDTIAAAFGVDGATSSCFSQTQQTQVNFVDSSLGASDSILWHFGDGFIDTARNPIHVYSAPGIYSCTLEAYGPCGADTMALDSLITLSDVLLDANVDFTVDTISGGGVAGSEFTFTDVTATGVILGRIWSVDGINEAAGVLSYDKTCDTAATYFIQLTVSNDCGTAEKIINLVVPPAL